ncbi:MAG: YceI family protein, partial [Bacteroidota bacterium]
PPPVNQYAGEMTELEGQIQYDPTAGLNSLNGNFTVPMRSLTMGDGSLTKAVQNAMLQVEQFPESSFVFESVQSDLEALAFGTVSPINTQGTFTMREVSIAVPVTAQIEPILNDAGEVRLLVNASFEITSLTPVFGVKGPDGPSPANNTVQFDLLFLMKPASD